MNKKMAISIIFSLIILSCTPLKKPLTSTTQKPIHTTISENRIRKKLPAYDINHTPISIWIIKDSIGDNFGFIISGHAEKSICEVASIEVMSKIKEIGENNQSMFSFGIAFDFRPKSAHSNSSKWSQSYNTLIESMEKKFIDLSKEHPLQVQVESIDYDTYRKTIEIVETHIKNSASNTEWDTHIVEYKYNNSPLILPFYQLNTGKEIRLKLKKSILGKIPHELALSSIKKTIIDAKREIQNMIDLNKSTMKELKSDIEGNRSFMIWEVRENHHTLTKYNIDNNPPKPPKGFYIKEYINGMYRGNRSITLEEAVKHLKENKETEENARRTLTQWINQSNRYKRNIEEKNLN